jgi:hypothetical protein
MPHNKNLKQTKKTNVDRIKKISSNLITCHRKTQHSNNNSQQLAYNLNLLERRINRYIRITKICLKIKVIRDNPDVGIIRKGI